MDDEQKKVPVFTELMRNFAMIFTLTILVMTFTGILIARYAPDEQGFSALFSLAGAGMPYNVILQLAGLAGILAGFTTLLFSGHYSGNIRFLWRAFLLMLATLIITGVFSILFNWLPASDPMYWVGLIISSIICVSAAIGLTLLFLKIQGRKYNKLLARYKTRHRRA